MCSLQGECRGLPLAEQKSSCLGLVNGVGQQQLRQRCGVTVRVSLRASCSPSCEFQPLSQLQEPGGGCLVVSPLSQLERPDPGKSSVSLLLNTTLHPWHPLHPSLLPGSVPNTLDPKELVLTAWTSPYPGAGTDPSALSAGTQRRGRSGTLGLWFRPLCGLGFTSPSTPK